MASALRKHSLFGWGLKEGFHSLPFKASREEREGPLPNPLDDFDENQVVPVDLYQTSNMKDRGAISGGEGLPTFFSASDSSVAVAPTARRGIDDMLKMAAMQSTQIAAMHSKMIAMHIEASNLFMEAASDVENHDQARAAFARVEEHLRCKYPRDWPGPERMSV